MLSGATRPAHSALAWVCTTAFGREVVPDVKTIPAGSIGSAGRSGTDEAEPNSDSNGSLPWANSSSEAGTPELSAVTTVHLSSGAASAMRAAYWGWVTAPTQPVWVAK